MCPTISKLHYDGVDMFYLKFLNIHNLNSNDNVLAMEPLNKNDCLQYIEGQNCRKVQLLME